MNSDRSGGLPDYNALAGVFDRYLPLIAPVTDAILDRLPALPDGAQVLDVACGTGEPGLSLARRSPGVQLLGVDAAAGMIEVARAKATREQLANVRFEVMTSEALACADGSMDAVLSRFGLLMFGDVAASARELARVLRPGGHLSVAVWHDMTKNTLANTVMAALRPHLPAELFAAFDRLTQVDVAKHLADAGITQSHAAPFSWSYRFPNAETLWDFVTLGVFAQQFAATDATVTGKVRLEVITELAAYAQADGSYLVPHACRIWWGTR